MTLRVALVIDGDSTGAKKAADETARAIGGLQQQARGAAAPLAAAAGATRQLAGDNDNLGKAVRGASGALAIMPGALGQVGAGLGVVALGFGAVTAAAIGMAGAVGGKAVGAFRQLELEQATYNAVIRATGMAAGRTAEDIEELATSIRKASTATEGEVRSAAAILLTFKSVSGEVFDDVLRLSQDLAAVGFGSVTGAATMMGKAFEDPERGLTALTRVGVTFSQAQQQLIKNFIETGRVGAAHELMVRAIRQQVGGAGAAQGNTLAGATNQLSEATNNLLERWGAQIAKGIELQAMLQGLAGLIDRTNKAAEQSASPEGRLAAARAELEDMQRRRAGGASQIAPTAAERALGGAPRRAGIGTDEVSERLLKEKVAAAEAAVEMDNYAKAHDRLIASVSAWIAVEDRKRDLFEGVVADIRKESAELRQTALQRQINAEIKRAEIDTTTAEGQARAKVIGELVRERIALKDGAQMIQARVAALGAAATEAEKLAAREVDLAQALREGTISRRDYDRALGAARLESVIGQEDRRLGLLGDLARVEDAVANTQRKINLERAAGMSISRDEEAAILSRVRIQTDAQRLESQLAFERAQLSRTAIEQRIAQEQRGAGIDPASGRGREVADLIRVNEQLKISKDLLTDAVVGGWRDFRTEIERGASAAQALERAGLNALNRISDKLMEMVLNNLVAKAFGGFNLFSMLGPAAGVSPGFSAGGYTGDRGRHQVAGVVHGREFVVNADATARHLPLLQAINDNRLPGYADGGFVGPPPPRLAGGSGGYASPINQINLNVRNEVSNTRVTVEDMPDGRGGRAPGLVFSEMVANAMQPGSAGHAQLLGTLGTRQQPRRMGA